MGKRGPTRTPTSVLKLRGSWRAKTRGDEPTPQEGVPESPDWLSEDEQSVWDRLTPLRSKARASTPHPKPAVWFLRGQGSPRAGPASRRFCTYDGNFPK